MSAELELAEQVMLLHEKQQFSDKLSEKQKHKEQKLLSEGSKAKYSSLYSSFDQLKPLDDDLPPVLQKVLPVAAI